MSRVDGGRLFLCLIGGLLAAIGLLFGVLMWRSFARARVMAEWPVAEARILRSEIGERRIGEGAAPEFRFEVLYGYEWRGERHTSDRLSLRGSPWTSRPAAVRERIASFPVGAAVECRVDPADPDRAVLEVDSRAAGYSIWFPALFVVGGAGIVIGALRRRAGGEGRDRTTATPPRTPSC